MKDSDLWRCDFPGRRWAVLGTFWTTMTKSSFNNLHSSCVPRGKKKPGFGVVQVVINKVLMYWFVVKVIGNCKASRWYFEWDFTGLFRTDVWGLYSSLNSRNSSNSLQQQQKTRDFACRQVHLPLQSTAESVNLQESERKSSRLGWTRLSLKPKEYQETEGNMHFGQGCGSEAERLPSMQ